MINAIIYNELSIGMQKINDLGIKTGHLEYYKSIAEIIHKIELALKANNAQKTIELANQLGQISIHNIAEDDRELSSEICVIANHCKEHANKL